MIFWSLDVAQRVSVGFLHLCYGLVGENGVSPQQTHDLRKYSVWSTVAAGRVTAPVEVHEFKSLSIQFTSHHTGDI